MDDTVILREAVGVIGALCAGNGPLRSVVLKAGAAIAAGCTVVLKPAPATPLESLLIGDFADAAGLRSYFASRRLIMDAGCGNAYTARLWLEPGWTDGGPVEWIGVDISTTPIPTH